MDSMIVQMMANDSVAYVLTLINKPYNVKEKRDKRDFGSRCFLVGLIMSFVYDNSSFYVMRKP